MLGIEAEFWQDEKLEVGPADVLPLVWLADGKRWKGMKDAATIIRLLETRLAHVYRRPLLFGSTSEGVDLILFCYHELWADILDRREEFLDVYAAVRREAKTGAMGFASSQKHQRRPLTDPHIAANVVLQWRKIDERLGLDVPAEPAAP